MRKDILGVVLMVKDDTKINMSAVARQYNCDPRTVARYYNARDKNPMERKKRVVKHVTDDFKEFILEKHFTYHAPAIEIYEIIKNKKEKPYTGSYSSVKRLIHTYKEMKIQEATIHFETAKGEQCQIDWKESLKLESKMEKFLKLIYFWLY